MAENVQQSVEVPVALQIFGSLVTEMNAADLPEGISPDNQDVVFVPGAVSSRPCMRGFIDGLPDGTTVTYIKTFTTPQGISLNLILTSDGQFWVQNTQVPPYTPQLLANVTPGSYASSVTAFGKELIAFHNNSSGTDIPRTYDGQYFDRATQGGPGAPPKAANLIIPSSQMIATSSGSITISTITTTNLTYDTGTRYYSSLTVVLSSGSVTLGQIVDVTGNSYAAFNDSLSVDQLTPTGFKSLGWYFPGPPAIVGTGGTATTAGNTLSRANNIVSVNTATPHGLIAGFQVQISKVDDATIATISSIVVDNESNPGVATVTTSTPHGLSPQNLINIINVASVPVGGSISSIVRSAQVVTASMSSAHNLQAGSVVNVAGVTDITFNGQFVVQSTPSLTTFSYSQIDVDASSTGGTVTLNWIPAQGGLFQNLFTVVSCPTPTTFEVQVYYTDGTWTSGTVTFSWNGIFYVTQVLSPTSFQYQQLGPNATSTDIGTVTPHSQISPGTHQFVVLFKTREGYITAPSPPGQIIANGSQYLQISDIPLASDNVVQRIIAFTGSNGSNFFYIPVPAFVNGIVVSTSTVVPNNVSTDLLVDFGDSTLFDSIAIDIRGNNLFQMGVLGPCLGVDTYASRATWFGMKNDVSNLLNLGFEGGYNNDSSGTPDYTVPLGWSVPGTGGQLDIVDVNWGMGWQIIGSGSGGADGEITQSAYRDSYGIDIFNSNTSYSVTFKLYPISIATGDTGGIHIDISSPTAGLLAEVIFPVSSMTPGTSNFVTAVFPQLPAVIPSDTVLAIYGWQLLSGTKIVVDEFEFYPTLIPTVPKFLVSYINSPESLDLLTGVLGATDDVTPIQASFLYRDAFLFLTATKLHETNDLVNYEPAEWKIRQIAENCGACSPRSCSSGENFSVWMTSPSSYPPVGRGLYIYTGGAVYKLSQEIQPDFDGVSKSSQNCIWVQNDSVTRRIYVGVPTSGATAPNRIYVLDYREMDSAAQIAEKPPIHISFSGKMIASDLSRKWTRWSVWANCGGIIYVPEIGLEFVVGGGNGSAPNTNPHGFPNAYWFDPTLYTDDDYGVITPYYTTYFFVNHEAEQALQVGLHRKLYKRYSIYIQGVGQFQVTPYANTLANPWPPAPVQQMHLTQNYDLGDGLNVSTERCAFKIASAANFNLPPGVVIPPGPFTDTSFNLSKFIVTLCQEPVSPIRFGAV